MAQEFLEKYVGGEDESESHAEQEGQVSRARLGGGGHEGPVIQTEQQTAGEQRQQTAVEDLRHQDHVGPVNWEQPRVQTFLTFRSHH